MANQSMRMSDWHAPEDRPAACTCCKVHPGRTGIIGIQCGGVVGKDGCDGMDGFVNTLNGWWCTVMPPSLPKMPEPMKYDVHAKFAVELIKSGKNLKQGRSLPHVGG